MKLMLLNNLLISIAAAVRDGDTYYLTSEEAGKFKTLLLIFSVLAIIGAVCIAVLIVALTVRYCKQKKSKKGGETE